MEAVIQRQRANYARFRKLFRAARKLDHIYLNDADKSRLGLVVYPLDYQSDKRATVPGQLQFFEPMQSDVFHGLPGPDFTAVPDSVDIGLIRSLSFAVDTYNHLVEVFPEEKKPSPNEFSLISSTKWELSSYETISRAGTGKNQIPCVSDYEWRGDALFGIDEDANFPHVVIFSVHSLNMGENDDQRITRGELVLILKIFMERMALPVHAEHEIYPILMVSFFNLKVRLLQAHFDGEFLHIQCSHFLDFTTDHKENKELLLRWVMSNPVGNTREPTKTVSPKKGSKLSRR